MVSETYNGWSNYETWNVAVWLQNDFGFYSGAIMCQHYRDFIWLCVDGVMPPMTPDGVYFDDRRVDHEALDDMIRELSK